MTTDISRCPGCGYSVDVSETFECNGYICHRCSRCETVRTHPLPSDAEILAHYDEFTNRYTSGMGPDRARHEIPKRDHAKLKLIHRFSPSGCLLDLGAAHRAFGRMAWRAGYDVSLGDFIPKPKALDFANIVPADVNRPNGVPFADGSFDVVTLFSCIEHVLRPDICIQELSRLARPGGWVVVDTPLVGDWCERHYPARSHWISPIEHLNLFSGNGLRSAFERARLTVIYHAYSFERRRARWLARRLRNLAVATRGVVLKSVSRQTWETRRRSVLTQAGDIQLLIARKPS